jgi:hypothetical protein
MLAVFSGALELLGTVDGAEGTGAEFEWVFPAGGGCAALDLLLLDFVALVLAADVFEAEFTVLAVELAECALAFALDGCVLAPLAVVDVFFTAGVAEFDGDAGCAFAALELAADADVAGAALAAGRTSATVDNTISTGAPADGCAAADIAGAVARVSVTRATGGATLLAAGATAGAELNSMPAGTGLEATLAGAGVGSTAAGRACAFAAACARFAALAGVLLLSSSSGGKFGNVLSGT